MEAKPEDTKFNISVDESELALLLMLLCSSPTCQDSDSKLKIPFLPLVDSLVGKYQVFMELGLLKQMTQTSYFSLMTKLVPILDTKIGLTINDVKSRLNPPEGAPHA